MDKHRTYYDQTECEINDYDLSTIVVALQAYAQKQREQRNVAIAKDAEIKYRQYARHLKKIGLWSHDLDDIDETQA